MDLRSIMLGIGDIVNKYPSDVASAFGPGALSDIPGWLTENLQQYGQRAGEFQTNVGKAFSDIQAGNKPDLGPLVQEAISVNPTMAGTWGPIRTPFQKQAVRAMWRHDPENVMAIQADPEMLSIAAPKPNVPSARAWEESGLMPAGVTAAFDPNINQLRVAPATLVGGHYQAPSDIFKRYALSEAELPKSPEFTEFRRMVETPRIVTRPGGTADLPEAMGHEASHFLNRNRVYERPQYENAAAMVDLLAPYVSQHGISSAIEAGFEHKNPSIALDEMLAYLTGRGTRAPENENVGRLLNQFLKVRTSPTGNEALELTPASIRRAIAMSKEAASPIESRADEAMGHWDRLAQAGMLPMREGYYQARTPYNQNPLFSSMKERTEPAPMYDRLARASRTFMSDKDIIRGQAGEQLPQLGSAMPDIPRPVSSPGGLDFFENLRKKLGLPEADLGGAAPEFYGKPTPPSSIPGKPVLESKRGSDALNEIYNDWVEHHSQITGSANIPKDRFMDKVISELATATNRGPAYVGLPQGISGFRRNLGLAENTYNRTAKPYDAQKSLDILDHLREYGLLEPGRLEKALAGPDQRPYVNAAGLERIRKLLERTGR